MELQHELAIQTIHIAVNKALNDIQTNTRNPYISLISRMVSDIDHETIKTFGTNPGYSVLTYGANKFKMNRILTGLKLPCFLSFDMSSDTGFGSSLSKIPEWINQGQELVIYCYGFSYTCLIMNQ